MDKNILIIGSTGKLGSKLLSFCYKNNLSINAITYYKNRSKAINQINKFSVKNFFCLNDVEEKNKFINHLRYNNYKIIYFLDYGSYSLNYLKIILRHQKNCIIAIANKELILSGGNVLINKFERSSNKLIPLDSEHFSLYNLNLKNDEIKKLYITASGGPFYSKKKIDLNKVELKDVLSHPKWKMGINNTIDSSNFINKFLEMFEVSILYKIDIKKVDFLISPNAYIHSIVIFNDNRIIINCFENDMMITMTKPLMEIFNINYSIKYKNFFNLDSLYFESFNDSRFMLIDNLKKLKNITHRELILFMLLNNLAHEKYLKGSLKYSDILAFIIRNLTKFKNKKDLKSLNEILSYINHSNKILSKL